MIAFEICKRLQGRGGEFTLRLEGTFANGAFVALFGASGAGKTTLLRVLAGLETPESGRIVVDGEVWFDAERNIHRPPQKRGIGMVFQNYALFPNMTVRENLSYAAGRGENAWIAELLELTGLVELAKRRPAQLSGGQRQRVALARALARRPKLLLLDEPLSALDADLRGHLQQQLAELHRRFELTTLLVSHDLAEVFRLADQVLFIEAGQVTNRGTPHEVFLRQRLTGRFALTGEVLAKRRGDVVWILSLLVGQEIVEVIAVDEEADTFAIGDRVAISAKAFSPLLNRVSQAGTGQ